MKKNVKGSQAWEQFELFSIYNSNDEEVFGIASCYYASLIWFIIE